MHHTTDLHHICSASTPVMFAGQTRPAKEWALIQGIKWQALRMRRYRGMNWSEALGEVRRGRKPTGSTSKAA
ncbi:hypothetical protein BKM17_17540 [Pseudomonas syringae group genomosp. 3]|nr:hypothetical protein BKM17_17540 [Pseudomonas syringae group genomosp. 3]